MQFQVPQFIETEEKIIGPLTIKQFTYLTIGGGLSALCFMLFETFLAVFLTFGLMAASISLAFVKINGRDMIVFTSSALKYIWKPRLYIFKVQEERAVQTNGKREQFLTASHTSTSGLRDLLDQLAGSKTAIPKRENSLPSALQPTQKNVKERYEVVEKLSGDKDLARKIDYR